MTHSEDIFISGQENILILYIYIYTYLYKIIIILLLIYLPNNYFSHKIFSKICFDTILEKLCK